MKMKGNIYGLDIKLTQIGQRIVPVVIELNGVDSGTDSFRYEEGFRYYEKFVRVLGAQARGKPLLIEGWSRRAYDPLEKVVRKVELEKGYQEVKKGCKALASVVGDHFEFEYGWLEDLLRFRLAKLEDTFDDTESRFYAYAARKIGVPLFVYKDVQFHSDHLDFDLIDGRRLRLQPDDIGLIRPRSSTLYMVPVKYRYLFLNSPLIETIMDSKPFTHFLVQVFGADIGKAFPPALAFGFGITDTKTLIQFLEALKSDLVVRKRGCSYCGTGVEILERQKVLESVKSRPYHTISPARVQALTYFIMLNTFEGKKFEDFLTMYEQFISSIPILNRNTGKFHDGCARVIVYSPPGEQPIVLGSQWRIATHHMRDTKATLEDKFRVNLSRGASAMSITLEHEAVMHDFAKAIVQGFEKAVESYKKVIHDYKETSTSQLMDIQQFKPDITELDIFRVIFWNTYLQRRLQEIGAIDDNDEIRNLPGYDEEQRKLPKIVAKSQELIHIENSP
ncbi:MAG: hypothetical protein AABX33_06890 [Nanoarchaeota archaeon]